MIDDESESIQSLEDSISILNSEIFNNKSDYVFSSNSTAGCKIRDYIRTLKEKIDQMTINGHQLTSDYDKNAYQEHLSRIGSQEI